MGHVAHWYHGIIHKESKFEIQKHFSFFNFSFFSPNCQFLGGWWLPTVWPYEWTIAMSEETPGCLLLKFIHIFEIRFFACQLHCPKKIASQFSWIPLYVRKGWFRKKRVWNKMIYSSLKNLNLKLKHPYPLIIRRNRGTAPKEPTPEEKFWGTANIFTEFLRDKSTH